MAHVKAQGAAKRTVQVVGKRLGVKKFGGEKVNIGTIIIRQRGTKFHAGKNAGMGKDHTIYAKAEGYVSFRKMTKFHAGQKFVDVLPSVVKAEVKATKKSAPKAEAPVKKTTTVKKKVAKAKTAAK